MSQAPPLQNKGPFKSPWAYDPEANLPVKSLWHLVLGDTSIFGRDFDKPIWIEPTTNESVNLRQLRQLSLELGYAFLHHYGLKRGDCIGLFAQNHILFPAILYSCNAVGLVVTFANFNYNESELQYHMNDSGVKMIISDQFGINLAQAVGKKLGLPKSHILNLAKERLGDVASVWEPCRPDKLVEAIRLKPHETNEVAFRCYSSGTTGRHKGVNSSHANVYHLVHQYGISKPNEYDPKLIGLGFQPFFHMYGAMCTKQVIVMSKFDLDTYCRYIEKYKVSYLNIVPPIALALAKSPIVDKYDLSSIVELQCGAAPLGPDLHKMLEDRLKRPVTGGYGMTESTCVISLEQSSNPKQGSVGVLLAGMEGRVVNGEMQLRGPNVTIGYHNRPDANAELFTEDGWMQTGDLVRVDNDGFIWIEDRLKEVIKYKGSQIAPAELESYLHKRSDVEDVCVVGVYEEADVTEYPRAYIQLKDPKDGNEAKALEIIKWFGKEVSSYKHLRAGIVFVDTIPKNPSGKLMRRFIRDGAKKDKPLGLSAFIRKAKL